MIELLISNVDHLILGFVQSAFGALSGSVTVIWRLMFILFIALFGYKVLIRGNFDAPALFINSIKIILLLAIATQWDLFFLLIYETATNLPSELAGKMMAINSTPGGPQDAQQAHLFLSHFYDRAMEVSSLILEGVGWHQFILYFYAFAVWFGALAFTGYAAMLIILAKLAVAILLALGPVFLLLLIFMNTKALFDGWLKTLLNYALLPIFVYTLLALLLSLAEAPLSYMEKHSGVGDALMSVIASFLFCMIVAVFLLFQAPTMTASITGGVSLSTMNAGQWLHHQTRKTLIATPRVIHNAGLRSARLIRHSGTGAVFTNRAKD